MDFKELLLGKLKKSITLIDSFKEFYPGGVSISVGFDIDMIQSYDGIAKFPIGTKHEPVGLSTTKSDYILVHDTVSKVYYVVRTQDIKDYIRKNIANLKRDIDEDYKYMVINVSIDQVKEMSEIVF